MRRVGLITASAAIAVAAASVAEAPNKAFLENTPDINDPPPLPEITEDPVTAENAAEPVAEAAEPEKPKRGRKKAEVSDESDSDG